MFTKILRNDVKSFLYMIHRWELFLAIEIKSLLILIIVILEFFHFSFEYFNSDKPSDILHL